RARFGTMSIAQMQARVISSDVVWDDLAAIREKWRGTMLLKGVMHPDDARDAIRIGCDGLVVSNHGGRQADYAPSAISVLPGIRAAVGADVPILIDSGIRRGSDVVRAKALGADFALAGRAFAYGAGAGGPAGCEKALDILEAELSRAVGQLGFARFSDVDATALSV
ncbi:MAG: alpha-hydroxy acid oxidase, partial [Pseudomonadota bacterium]